MNELVIFIIIKKHAFLQRAVLFNNAYALISMMNIPIIPAPIKITPTRWNNAQNWFLRLNDLIILVINIAKNAPLPNKNANLGNI